MNRRKENDPAWARALKGLRTPEPGPAYWKAFWPRLSGRLDEAAGAPVRRSSPEWAAWVAAPALAGLLVAAGFWLGHRRAATDIPGMRLASVSAPRSAGEILALFPLRVRWVAQSGDALDFSVNPTPFDTDETLVPLSFGVSVGESLSQVNMLVRPGEESSFRANPSRGLSLSLRVAVDPEGRRVRVHCRLDQEGESGSLEASVALAPGASRRLGQFSLGTGAAAVSVVRGKSGAMPPAPEHPKEL